MFTIHVLYDVGPYTKDGDLSGEERYLPVIAGNGSMEFC